MKENPRDPEEIKQPGDTNDYPSFFAFPEWEAFKEKYNMWEVRVELGAFGNKEAYNLRHQSSIVALPSRQNGWWCWRRISTGDLG